MRQTKKAAAKAKVDEAVTTAKNAIDPTNNNGRHYENKRVDQLTMQPTVVKKDEAKAEIDKAAEAKKEAIDQRP